MLCVVCLMQWLFGFVVFWYPGLQRTTREKALPWHVLNGLLIFLLAICTAQTGLVEEAAFSNLVVGTQARLFNFTGIFVILYAIAVSLSILHRWNIVCLISVVFLLWKPGLDAVWCVLFFQSNYIFIYLQNKVPAKHDNRFSHHKPKSKENINIKK